MLTKQDIQALRTANTVSFHYHDDKSYIAATKETPSDPWNTSQSREITLESPYDLGEQECFEMIHGSKHSMCWQTIVKTLRAGDVIYLEWYRDAKRNQYCEAADLHADALYLHTERNGKQRGKYFIDVSICPDNTARMIRS